MALGAEHTLNEKKEVLKKEPLLPEKKVNPHEIAISKHFKHKVGMELKPRHLWDKYWRVNYHSTSGDNCVAESYFVTIDGEEVLVVKD